MEAVVITQPEHVLGLIDILMPDIRDLVACCFCLFQKQNDVLHIRDT